MTTDEAFLHLIQNEFLWQRTGLSDSRRRALRSRIQNGKPAEITLDKKMQLLDAAGFYKRQDVAWGLKGGIERD